MGIKSHYPPSPYPPKGPYDTKSTKRAGLSVLSKLNVASRPTGQVMGGGEL